MDWWAAAFVGEVWRGRLRQANDTIDEWADYAAMLEHKLKAANATIARANKTIEWAKARFAEQATAIEAAREATEQYQAALEARHVEAAEANARLAGMLAARDRQVEALQKLVAAYEADDKTLRAALEAAGQDQASLLGRFLVKEAECEASDAVIDAFLEQHKDSPLLKVTGETFKRGDCKGGPKSVVMKIYEKAFDAHIRAHAPGVDPVQFRDD